MRLRVSQPDWSGDAVDVCKLFTFRPQDDLVIRLDDCVDWQNALALLHSG